jgi:hypothetical protein
MIIGVLFLLLPAPVPAVVVPQKAANPLISPYTAVYENATLTEDVTLRGTVAVTGALVIAPQATLRIEPGAVVHFLPARGSRQSPRLVVMGRIQAVGSPDHPITFSGNSAGPAKSGAWAGILLLSSEKRNQLEHCRIEGAETGLAVRFSTFSAKALSVSSATAGIVLHDSTATVTSSLVSGCQTGVEAHDSEVELRESSVVQNRKGLALFRSSVVLSTVTMTGNRQFGILSEECRLKLTSCEFSGSAIGARISGGEGQVLLSRFIGNLETALHLSAARLKISRCQISDNLRDGVKLEDGRATLWGNQFSGNGGYNLVVAGHESVTAVQNWWGASDETSVLLKIYNAGRDGRFGEIQIFPWLAKKPTQLP